MSALFFWTGAIVWAVWLAGMSIALGAYLYGKARERRIQRRLRTGRLPRVWYVTPSRATPATIEELIGEVTR